MTKTAVEKPVATHVVHQITIQKYQGPGATKSGQRGLLTLQAKDPNAGPIIGNFMMAVPIEQARTLNIDDEVTLEGPTVTVVDG